MTASLSDFRVAHVIRIQNDHSGGGNPLADGTPPDQVASDDNIWLDMLRLDEVRIRKPNASQGVNQDILYVMKWLDGPSDQLPANDRRKMKTVKITNSADSSQWVKVDIIERAAIAMPNASQGVNQIVNHVFANGGDNTVRDSDVITLYNCDVSSLDMSQPVDWFAVYQPALIVGAQDKSQSLSAEIPKTLKITLPNASQGVNQTVKYVMNNADVKDAINQTGP